MWPVSAPSMRDVGCWDEGTHAISLDKSPRRSIVPTTDGSLPRLARTPSARKAIAEEANVVEPSVSVDLGGFRRVHVGLHAGRQAQVWLLRRGRARRGEVKVPRLRIRHAGPARSRIVLPAKIGGEVAGELGLAPVDEPLQLGNKLV